MEEKKKKLQKSYFDVLGLCCSSEVPLIENILKPLEGVKEVSVVVTSRTVIVVHDTDLISQQQIVKALNQARLEANVRAYGKTSFRKKWPSPFAIACGVLLAVSFFKFVYDPMKWLAVAAVAVGIYPVLLKGYAAIRNLRFDVNILMLIAVVGTLAMQDYIEAGTIVFLFTTAEWLESRASHKATAVMSSLMSITPQKAVIAETGVEVDVDEVKLNTILAVKAGEVIPLDGVVVDGRCEVDEKTLTGESFPVAKEKDSIVWAGTMNLNGYITVKTTAIAEDCVVAKMAKLVEEAQNSKSKTQRFIDKCAQFYTPAVVLISASIAIVPLALKFDDRTKWFHLALVVLVSACPCALILSTPVATFCALTQAATSGLLVKGGDYLETLSKIKITAFDKTGTITRGEFSVTDFQSVSEDINQDTMLYWVSSIESKSSHPMAAALVEYGRMHSIEPKPENVEDYQNFPGEGIYGKIEGKDIFIGNKRIAERAGGAVPDLEGKSKEGKTSGYVFAGANPVGTFSLSDSCRTGVAEAIKELKSMGIKSAMLTGDNRGSASHVQEQLNNALDIIHAELLPEDKAEIIRTFKKEGPTAMIGDGINDAPALATADIGISMGISGSALATETGHVILMSNDIRKIPKAIKLARRAHRKVIENVFLSISTKAAIIALAIAGHPLVWAAVLCDVGTCLLVILNSMLLLRGNQKHGGNHSHSSHNHKHSHSHSHSSGNKVHKGCEAQKCCSAEKLTSCGDKQFVSSTKEESVEQKHGGCCNKKLSTDDTHPPLNSCGDKQCVSSTKKESADRKHGGCCNEKLSSHEIPPPLSLCGDKQCVSSTKKEFVEQKHGGCCNKKASSHDIPPPLNSCGDKQCVSSTKNESVEQKHGGCCNKKSSTHDIPPPLNSCGDNRCVSTTKEHDICVLKEETLEPKQGGCCNEPSLDIEAQRCSSKKCASKSEPIPPPLNSSGDNRCISSTKQGGCCSSKASPVVKASNCCSATPSEKQSSCEENHGVHQEKHCHSITASKCCGGDNHSKVETVVENCCSKVQDPEPGECAATASCKSSEKREGGCCKSYMKECCSKKHGQFGAGFGGGLTEIITE